MVGKHLQYRVWEHDRGKHDLIYTSERIKIKGDIITTGGFTILKGHFEKGIDFGSLDPDSTSQNYYLEVT